MDALQDIDDYVKARIAPFVVPMFHTLLNLSVLLVFAPIFLTLATNSGSIMVQIQFLSTLFAILLCGGMSLLSANEELFNKRFKKPIRDWLILAVFIATSICVPLFLNFQFNGLVVISLTFIYIFVSIEWSLKEIEI
ncbi:hypothetical protein B9G55_07760 [Saccharibacillus sp. O16]|nr:hypothetical protein B9G55_07760 [Saccharibacillus sp. O16]